MGAFDHQQQESDPSDEVSLVGHVLGCKYLVVRELGAGGMGTVYEGRNLVIGRRVAIKTMLRRHRHDVGLIERFEREAQAAALIDHPGVVDVLDLGHDDEGLPYIVMEYLEGECLFTRLARGGPLHPSEAVRIVLQLAEALAASHAAGVIHRDIKPDNIFLVRRNDCDDRIKILDFGVARFAPPTVGPRTHVTAAGCAVGTPCYMAPEQAFGAAVDERSDLYSTGVVLYELLTGRLPVDVNVHTGERSTSLLSRILTREPVPLLAVAPWVPAELAALVSIAMSRVPGERFQTALELMHALQPFAAYDDDARFAQLRLVPRTIHPVEHRPRVALRVETELAATAEIASRRTVRIRVPRRSRSMWMALALLVSALIFASLVVRQGGSNAGATDRRPPSEAALLAP